MVPQSPDGDRIQDQYTTAAQTSDALAWIDATFPQQRAKSTLELRICIAIASIEGVYIFAAGVWAAFECGSWSRRVRARDEWLSESEPLLRKRAATKAQDFLSQLGRRHETDTVLQNATKSISSLDAVTRRRSWPRVAIVMTSLPALEEAPIPSTQEGQFLEPDLRDFVTQIIDQFPRWSEQKRRKDTDDLVNYLEDNMSVYTVPTFYNRFTKEDEHGLDIDKLQILPCERQIKTKLVKFFVHGEPGLWRESIFPTFVPHGKNPLLKPHQEEPYSYSAKSFLRGPFAIVRTAMSADSPPRRVALKEYSPEIDVSYDILIQNLMLPHPNGLKTLCTYRTTRTGKVVQKMAMEPWCDYRLEDIINAGAYGLDLVLRVGYCLGSLLYHIHCHGVKHVNINPRNILLTEEGGIFLSDLSSSRIYVENDDEDGNMTPLLSTPGASFMGDFDTKTERGRLTHPSSVSTMAQLTIQTDLFYTAPEQKVDVSRRGTDIWMLGVTLLELLYSLGDKQERIIRDPNEFGYMVAALSTSKLRSKLRNLPSVEDEVEEKIRLELVDIVSEVLVQQPMDRPSAFEIHQRLAAFASKVKYPLQLNPDPELAPVEAAKDVIRAKIPYSVHEHTTIKGEDDHFVDLSRGEKKVRFGNDFHVDLFEAIEDGDENGEELTEERREILESQDAYSLAKSRWAAEQSDEELGWVTTVT